MRAWLPVLLCAVCAAQSSRSDVVKAELAFARLASEKGIHDAFMANLAEGSLVLGPEPVDARALYAKNTDTALLSWRPAWVGVSASGDLACSTGPWDYRATKDAAPIAHGHFLSLWARQADGAWKVAFDCGVPHDGSEPVGSVQGYVPPVQPAQGNGEDELKAADHALSDGKSIARNLFVLGRVYRRGEVPIGQSAVQTALAQEPARRFEPMGARASKAQDLGYTWGAAAAADGSRVSYCHVWVRPSGAWQLLYDLELPLPAKP